MNAWIKGVLGLLTLAIGIALAWWLSNRWDVAPQPLPAALALPTDAAPADGLLQRLDRAPQLAQPLNLPNCSGLDCSGAWRAALPALQQRLLEQPEFGEACAKAAEAEPALVIEAMPESWTPAMAMPTYTPLSNCVKWGWIRALAASEAGDAQATLAALQQADRLARALLHGARMPYGHMQALSLLGRQLNLLMLIAERQPALRAELLPFAEIEGAALMAGARRWIVAEAAFGRGAVDSIQSGAQSEPTALRRAFVRFVESSWQPEYAKQLMNSQWLRALAASQGDDPQAALLRHQTIWQAEPGWFGTSFRWFHTVPHLLFDTALPAYITHFQRPADLQLASQATALWLRGGRPEQAQGLLRERLSQASDGVWQLRLHTASGNPGMPTQWPTPN